MNYGEPVPALPAQYAGLVNGDLATTTPPTCTTTPASPTQAGTYPVHCSGAVDTLHYSISDVAGTLTIDKVPLTITAPSSAMVLSGQSPSLVPQYTGLVAGDGPSSLADASDVQLHLRADRLPTAAARLLPGHLHPAAGRQQLHDLLRRRHLHRVRARHPRGRRAGAVPTAVPSLSATRGRLPRFAPRSRDPRERHRWASRPRPPTSGYYLVGKDGEDVFTFNTPFLGSLPGLGLGVDDIVGIVPTPGQQGLLPRGQGRRRLHLRRCALSRFPARAGPLGVRRRRHRPDARRRGVLAGRSLRRRLPLRDAASSGDAPGGGIVSIAATQGGGAGTGSPRRAAGSSPTATPRTRGRSPASASP